MDLPQGCNPWGFSLSRICALKPRSAGALVQAGALPLPPHLHPRALRKGSCLIALLQWVVLRKARSTIPLSSILQTQLSVYSRALRRRLKALAARRMRFGYRRLTAMLLPEGVPANHKRVYRLYREEGLAMRIRQRWRIRWSGAVSHPVASRPNERWSMDFVSDCVSTGRVIRMLTIVDDCTRECPVIEVDTSLGGLRVGRVLDRMAIERGLPEAIVVDNGPEFRGRALAAWSEERGVRLEFIQPGKPVQNAYIESFNGRLRDECLNANWFTSLSDARRKIETWRKDYNEQRPHSSLNYLPPAEFARTATEVRA